MKIREMEKIERPREKLRRYGMQKLSNAELLALILGNGRKGENVLQLSKKVLKQFKNVSLLNASISQLNNINGIGWIKSARLLAGFELFRRINFEPKTGPVDSPSIIWQQFKYLGRQKKEHFIAVYLDARNVILDQELVSIGSLDMSVVHPREVFEPAIRRLAASVILLHNHPSGEATASEADLIITKKLVESGKILGIEVLDHVIITEEKYFSFKEEKLINS